VGLVRAAAAVAWLLVAGFLLALPLNAAAVAPWNQFRGPTGDGHAQGSGFPLEFSETRNVRWKTPLDGKAWSSPVVWGRQVWVTNAPPDGRHLYAVCLSLETGAILKNILVLENENPQFCHPVNSYASPTPVIEEGRIYVHFGSPVTACLDTDSGAVLWARHDLPCDHFRGPGSSPIVDGNLLIMHFDGFDEQYVVALDKRDGRTVWRNDRAINYETDDGDFKKAYGTPAIIHGDGRRQLISPAAVATEALDPATGQLLWTVYHGGMNASARPVFGHGLVYITNGMGRLTAVRPEGRGDLTGAGIAWDSTRGVPKKSSLLLVGDLLFMVSDIGVAACVEARTGQEVWSRRLGGEYAASPILADGRIYLCSEQGTVTVIAPERQLQVLATNQLDDGFMASPAAAGRSLILRSRSHLYRLEQ